MQSKPIIEVKNLHFQYGGEEVLKGLTFNIYEGDYVGIIGPNGGGKTTLIKILLGLLPFSSGEVELFNKSLRQFREFDKMGYVPQRIAYMDMNFPATVKEIVTSGRMVTRGPFSRLDSKDKEAIQKVMKVTEIESLQHRLIGKLSGGERQRVFIARALASDPLVLILDEPTVGVDVSAQKKFYEFLKKLNKEHKITILFITHDIDVIAKEATKVLCLNHQLVCYGLPTVLNDEKLHDLYETDVKHVHDHGHEYLLNKNDRINGHENV